MVSRLDAEFLAETLDLAEQGGSAVRPNPQVGAVVVKGIRVISRGYHDHYGGPHAEAVALERAGSDARGATVYCNLEPCSYSAPDKHNGPCTAKLIDAGVSRVVIGQLDPNPRVRGRGVQQLREAGIEVDIAPDPARSWYANARFNTWHSLGRPFVTVKLAQSLDGRIATRSGDSRWISDMEARREVHALRAGHDAVMVGRATAERDDPQLTVRHGELPAGHSQPRAVVLDTDCRLSPDSFLVRERAEELILVAGAGPTDRELRRRMEALRGAGVEVLEVPRAAAPGAETPEGSAAGLALSAALKALGEAGIQSVLVEGGAALATNLLREGLFDELRLYIAPILLGGDGVGIGTIGVDHVAEALRLEGVSQESREGHLRILGFREGWLAQTRRTVEEVRHVHRVG